MNDTPTHPQKSRGSADKPGDDLVQELVGLYQSRNYELAERRAAELVDNWPRFEIGWNIWGGILAAQSKHAEAVVKYRKTVEVKPDYGPVYNNLGLSLIQLKKYEGALAAFRNATLFMPDNADCHKNHGNVLRQLGKLDQAVASFEKAIELGLEDARIYISLGVCLQESNDLPGAVEKFRRAVELAPEQPYALHHLANALQRTGKFEAAIRCYKKALTINPNLAEAFNGLGAAYLKLGRYEESEKCYRRAVELKPELHEAWNNLGAAQQGTARFEEAVESYRMALKHKPDYVNAMNNMMRTNKIELDDPIVAEMVSRLKDPATAAEDKGKLASGLGHLFERHGEHEKAFAYWLESGNHFRSLFDFDIQNEFDVVNRVRSVFTREFFDALPEGGDPSRQPIFLLGMPRSGTSLVEQIMSSHRDISGAGELHYLSGQSRRARRMTGAVYPEAVAKLSLEQRARLGEIYVRQLNKHNSGATKFTTDKMPANFWHIGLIEVILPGAKIINIKRNPMDTCLSIFAHFFAGHHPYSHNLEELGQYYRLYQSLMAHWEDVLGPGRIHTVVYEDLVADLEGETRRLLDYCGLDFDPACLEFHKNERAVSTASSAQVREKLYTKSIDRWRRYEAGLAPLIEVLEAKPDPV